MSAGESWRNVGLRIRYLRKEQGLTLKQLAAGCGLSPNAISLVERGEVAPTVATLCKIASALGVSASSFLYEICPNEVILVRARNGVAAHPAEQLAENLFSDVLLRDRSLACNVKLPGYPPQMVLCVCGQIEFEDSYGQAYTLNTGDRLSCNGDAPQRWRNPGGDTAVAIVIIPGVAYPTLNKEDE